MFCVYFGMRTGAYARKCRYGCAYISQVVPRVVCSHFCCLSVAPPPLCCFSLSLSLALFLRFYLATLNPLPSVDAHAASGPALRIRFAIQEDSSPSKESAGFLGS